jgi:hypothetical protein
MKKQAGQPHSRCADKEWKESIMDITDASTQRFELAIEQFRNGDSLSYENVVFCWGYGGGQNELFVLSYSDCIHMKNIRPEEAKKKIARSKEVAEELVSRSPAFRDIWESAPKRFQFCFDYHTGAVMLAEEVAGEIAWSVELPSQS